MEVSYFSCNSIHDGPPLRLCLNSSVMRSFVLFRKIMNTIQSCRSLRYYVYMVDIDENWLASLGVITADDKEVDELLDIIDEELEVRVGTKVIGSMSPEQLKEFEKLDEDKREAFIDKVFPEYDTVVTQEYNFIGYQITKSKDKIALIKSWAA
jgi:hypothetical protein